MRIDRSEWRRKHDDPRAPALITSPLEHLFPESRADLIEIVRRSLGAPKPAVRACGSHWALSAAAVTDSFVVETRGFAEPDGFPERPLLNRTLDEVIPGCLTDAMLDDLIAQPTVPFDADPPDERTFNYYHVEAGTRIFELYSRLDAGTDMPTRAHPRTRDLPTLQGPWAMPTLGGAGGQTIVGAFSTGTHGGDQHMAPIADAVQAIHLIGGDAREYWIERGAREQEPLALVDDKRLRDIYPGIEIIRDNDVFNGVVVSVGRMGIIYSVVLRVVRQYALRQQRFTDSWNAIATRLRNPADPLFRSRFLQIVLNPHAKPENPTDHTCYVQTRELTNLAGMEAFRGRVERAGANAGRNAPLDTDDVRLLICSLDNTRPLVASLILMLHGAIAAIWATPVVGALLGPIVTPPLLGLASALTPLLSYPGTLGELVTDICNMMLAIGHPGLVGMVNHLFLDLGQPPIPSPGRTDFSYAIMDIHDYRDRGCIPTADSLTVSFDAARSDFLTFIDTMFARLGELHAGTLVAPPPPGLPPTPIGRPMSFVGYASLRFTGRSEGLIAMQRWPRTCNIEIAGIRNLAGSDPFLRRLEADAAALGATVHWGQKHEGPLSQVERTFPELDRWRAVLARFTANGRLVNFRTPFSVAKGLEVVQPRIQSFESSVRYAVAGDPVDITWDARDNPPETTLRVRVTPLSGAIWEMPITEMRGRMTLSAARGFTRVQLIASLRFGGTTREDTRDEVMVGFADGDTHRLSGLAVCGEVEGVSRWMLTIPYAEGEWSPRLMAGNMRLSGWRRGTFVRKTGASDVLLTNPAVGVEFLAEMPMAGTWVLFAQADGCGGDPPTLGIDVQVRTI